MYVVICFLIEAYMGDIGSEQIGRLMKYIIPNLLNQTSQNYICFIEYKWEDVEQVRRYENDIGTGGTIVWIPKSGTRYRSGVYKSRSILSMMESHIQKFKEASLSNILFIHWPIEAVFSVNMIEVLSNYKIRGKEKVIRFKKGYDIQPGQVIKEMDSQVFEGFAYICSLDEYDRYFKVYQRIMGLRYEMFDEFPVAQIEEIKYFVISFPINYRALNKLLIRW